MAERRGPPWRLIPAGLLLVLALGSVPAVAEWSEFGPVPAERAAAGDSIREPFFAFLLDKAERDSLGRWTAADVEAFAAARGTPSRFPLELLQSVSRQPASAPDSLRAVYPGVRVRAVWEVRLTEDLDRPMPYDILGYHPGSLRVARRLDLVELGVGEHQAGRMRLPDGQAAGFTNVWVFAVAAGYLVLDADGFVDALLGSALDDAWTVGMVTAREGARRVGLGVSLGRDGRRIYGEFDFVRDKVLPHGRPAASVLSGFARRWLDPARGQTPPAWQEGRKR